MSRLKKILLGIAITLVLLVGLFVLVVGPWPTYSDSHFETSKYYHKALADIDKNIQQSDFTNNPAQLRVGWGVEKITPPVGTPMGGYSGRPNGKRSEGVRDELHVKAVAFNDGKDTFVLVGIDMLITSPNIADAVRKNVALQTKSKLTANDIQFCASHTHCGPGAFGPGIAAKISAGKYDPAVESFLVEQYTKAIISAYDSLRPAKLAYGSVDAPQFIRNRTRKAPVDSLLNYMVIDQVGGKRCYVVRYSAHPTNFGTSMMEFSAEYPGELMRSIEAKTGATAVYLGGAVGSMGPRSPEAETRSDRVKAMGEALAKVVLENTQTLEFQDKLDIVSVGIPVGMPSAQMRPLSPSWRVSPLLAGIFGVPKDGWFQCARIGKLLFVGMPYDFSGEINREWQAWAKQKGYELWGMGFCGTYCGYLSPDKYYKETKKNMLDYEVGFMSWFGPNAEAYFHALVEHAVEGLAPKTQQAAL